MANERFEPTQEQQELMQELITSELGLNTEDEDIALLKKLIDLHPDIALEKYKEITNDES